MSFRVTTLWRSGWLALLLGSVTLPVVAQVPNSPVVFAQSAITTSFVSPTNVGGSGGSGNSDLQWLKVEFHYSVAPANGKFLDSAEFRVWIEGRDLYAPEAIAANSTQGVPVGLTGSVTYVNLVATKDAYGVFFLPPDTVARFSTARGPSDFDRNFNIHIEAYVGGTKVDYFDKNKEADGNWYQTALKPLSGFVMLQNQTPFIVSDPDRYPPIKVPTASQ
jgi:hypothetical protein